MKTALMNKVQSWLTETIQKATPVVQKEVKKVVSRSTTDLKDHVMAIIPALVMVACMVDVRGVKKSVSPSKNCTDAIQGLTLIYNEYHNTYNYYGGEGK